MELYVDAANRHISMHVSKHTTSEISRAKVDFLVLESLDKSDLDLEFKFAWYNTVSVLFAFCSRVLLCTLCRSRLKLSCTGC